MTTSRTELIPCTCPAAVTTRRTLTVSVALLAQVETVDGEQVSVHRLLALHGARHGGLSEGLQLYREVVAHVVAPARHLRDMDKSVLFAIITSFV